MRNPSEPLFDLAGKCGAVKDEGLDPGTTEPFKFFGRTRRAGDFDCRIGPRGGERLAGVAGAEDEDTRRHARARAGIFGEPVTSVAAAHSARTVASASRSGASDVS